VHGGCWVAKLGNLDDRAVALDLVRPIAAALTSNGIATWNVEYRRVGNDGGGWPGTSRRSAGGLRRPHVRRANAGLSGRGQARRRHGERRRLGPGGPLRVHRSRIGNVVPGGQEHPVAAGPTKVIRRVRYCRRSSNQFMTTYM